MTEKERELNSEQFWEQIGAATALLTIACYLLPILIAVFWFVSVSMASRYALLVVTTAFPKTLQNTIIFGIFAIAWEIAAVSTFSHCWKFIRKILVKSHIKKLLRRERRQTKTSAEFEELKEWIRKQGFHFEGGQNDAT